MEIDISSYLYTTAFTVPIIVVTLLLALGVFIFGVLLSIQAGMKKGRFLVAFFSLLIVMAAIAGTLFIGFASADWLNHNAGNRDKIRTSMVLDLFEEELQQEIEINRQEEDTDGPRLKADPVIDTGDGITLDIILEDGELGSITVEGDIATLEFLE